MLDGGDPEGAWLEGLFPGSDPGRTPAPWIRARLLPTFSPSPIQPIRFLTERTQTREQIMVGKTESYFDNMQWRHIGPAVFGGRIPDVEAVPDNPAVMYVAGSTGGIFKGGPR